MSNRNDLCWCGSNKKWKKCHFPKKNPKQNTLAITYLRAYRILLKNEEQIIKIRKASRLAAKILDELCKAAQIGVTLAELNELANILHQEAGAIPAPLGYGSPPFPKSICTSLNDVICHGIPDDTPLQDGDILNIDVTSILDGHFGDCSRMVTCGTIAKEKQKVVDVSLECLHRAANILRPGVLVCDIGNTIEAYASSQGCSVVHQFVGHGVGVHFHEEPRIPHNANHLKIPLAPGMTFTIEPMINAGVATACIDPHDHWTARTADGKPSAQWEHTFLITETGHEILTIVENR